MTTLPPGWPSNEIERLFEAAVKDPAARPTLERAILEAELFIIVDGDGVPEGRVTLEPGTRVGVRMMHDPDGTTGVPAFTSLPLLERAIPGEPVRYGAMRGEDLFTLVRGSRVRVNPFGPYGKEFFAEEIEHLLRGETSADNPRHMTLGAGTQVLLGQLAHKPADLLAAVSEALAREPAVGAAYLAAIGTPGENPAPHPIIGIECSGDYEGVRARLAPVLTKWAAGGDRLVDLVDMADDSVVTRHLRGADKFYPKSRLRRMFGR